MILITHISASSYQTNYVDYSPCVSTPDLEAFFEPCFLITKEDNCDYIRIKDATDYEDENTDDVSISISMLYRNCCNDEYVSIMDATSLDVATQEEYSPSMGAGYYRAVVTVTFVKESTTYTKEILLDITLDCCKCKLDELISKVKTRIGKIGCKIASYERIGRDRTNLHEDLLKLNSALFYLEYSTIVTRCRVVENVECFLKSIKNYC